MEFAEARDDGVAVASAISYANHKSFAPHSKYIALPALNFYRPDALSEAQPSVKTVTEHM